MSKHVRMKAIAFLAVLCIVLSLSGRGQAAVTLSDIPGSSATEINYLMNQDVISGYSDGTFRPKQAVTRAEAAIMLGKALKLDGTPRFTSFWDVGAGSAASGYIASAVSKGIISGFSDGTYRPTEPITRGQMALLLQRGFQLTEQSNVYFHDIPSSGPQYEAINTIATAGLTIGYADGTFQPKDEVTRQDFAVFVARGLNEDFRVTAPPPAPAPAPPEPGGSTTGEVTIGSLNVRSAPSNSAAVIGTIAEGTVVTVYSLEGYWAKINYNNQQGYVHKTYLKLKNASGSVLQNRIIVIDPGHGGLSDKGILDQGASFGNLKEKDITLDVANRVTAKLKAAGANIVQTRTGDVNRQFLLGDRTQIAYDAKAELFVSIHVNSAPTSPSANGAETYYDTSENANGDESRELAQEIQAELVKAGMNDRKAKDSAWYVIREQNIPSVLVELGFITNSEDYTKLASPEFHETYAQAVYQGIYNYYSH